MAISAESRYRTATLQTAVGADGETRQEMRPAFPRSRQVSFTYYRVVAAERIENIAYNQYGDARLWWIIADANPEILDWFDLEPGKIIRVPSA